MISDAVYISVVTVVGGIATMVVKKLLDRLDRKVDSMLQKTDEVHKQINGKMERLLEVTGAKERAEGKAEGIAQKQGEVDQLNKDSTPK